MNAWKNNVRNNDRTINVTIVSMIVKPAEDELSRAAVILKALCRTAVDQPVIAADCCGPVNTNTATANTRLTECL